MAGEPASSALVCLGVVTGARGLRGEVRIKPFTADPEDLDAYGKVRTEDGERSFKVRVKAIQKGQAVATLSGVGDRNAAEALKGVKLFVQRSQLPKAEEDEFYYADLVGLRADGVTGETLGRIKAVHDFGAGDLIEIALEDPPGREVLVPFTREAVPEVDVKAGRVVVDPPPGLMDEPEETPDGLAEEER